MKFKGAPGQADKLAAMRASVCKSFSEIHASEWNALLAAQRSPTPFVDHRFLLALEQSGSTRAQSGWQPLPLTIRDDQGELVAAAPMYAKGHSYGEYVFDWAWADAYERAGLQYFPKLLIASPFSPIPGARLLARTADAQAALMNAITEQVKRTGVSSAHVLFADATEIAMLAQAGWLVRENVQFHWMNHGYQSFEDYLAALTQPKRKKIKAERRKVREAGVTADIKSGLAITESDWAFFYRCYERTYLEHRSTPYLSLGFFLQAAALMPDVFVMCIAHRDGKPIASSLLMQSGGVLYGRYWGAMQRVDCLHFEVAYYAPIEWAVSQGLKRFEGGAQGEHKLARGFEPVKTASAHWLDHPEFKDAVARHLARESHGMERYVNELESRSPVRPTGG